MEICIIFKYCSGEGNITPDKCFLLTFLSVAREKLQKSATQEENPRFSSWDSPLLFRATRVASLIARNAPQPRRFTRFAVGATRKSLRGRIAQKWTGYLDIEKFVFPFGVKVSKNLKKKIFLHTTSKFSMSSRNASTGKAWVFATYPSRLGFPKGSDIRTAI